MRLASSARARRTTIYGVQLCADEFTRLVDAVSGRLGTVEVVTDKGAESLRTGGEVKGIPGKVRSCHVNGGELLPDVEITRHKATVSTLGRVEPAVAAHNRAVEILAKARRPLWFLSVPAAYWTTWAAWLLFLALTLSARPRSDAKRALLGTNLALLAVALYIAITLALRRAVVLPIDRKDETSFFKRNADALGLQATSALILVIVTLILEFTVTIPVSLWVTGYWKHRIEAPRKPPHAAPLAGGPRPR